MIVIYTAHGCASCRKAKAWLKENNIGFIEKNIFKTLLDKNEIKYLLSRTDNGTEDIISNCCPVFFLWSQNLIQDMKVNVDELGIDELCDFVVNNPSVLKRPIIISEKDMQIGYDEEEIDSFRKEELLRISSCDKTCPHFELCGYDEEAKA